MATAIKEQIEQKIIEILTETPDLFLVNIKIDAKNNIKVFVDGDAGITIGQCTSINRSLYPFIEEAAFFPNDDFSLEVSSAGVDEPLLLERQYVKNIGRNLEVLLTDGSKLEGKLTLAENATINLEIIEGKGKKAITKNELIELSNIKAAIVQIKF
jgi:ribosome maturation factor RimP